MGNLKNLKQVSKSDVADGLGPCSRRKRKKILSPLNVEAAVVQHQISCLKFL